MYIREVSGRQGCSDIHGIISVVKDLNVDDQSLLLITTVIDKDDGLFLVDLSVWSCSEDELSTAILTTLTSHDFKAKRVVFPAFILKLPTCA